MNLLKLTPAEFCAATKACAEGREFALRHETMAEVWDACPRTDWLIWICRKVDWMPAPRTLRLFAVWCARYTPIGDGHVTGDLLTDPRLLAALEVAERYAHGRATDAELVAADAYAADAARAAAYAADAARAARAADAAYAAYAAYYAAYAAYYAAYAADAAYAARAAAYAADAARAARAAAAAYAADAARAAARQAQADQFRCVVDNPFRP
jgi:hypothetical protein